MKKLLWNIDFVKIIKFSIFLGPFQIVVFKQ
jgi:hypothetical protein